jgi:hypothetical protein
MESCGTSSQRRIVWIRSICFRWWMMMFRRPLTHDRKRKYCSLHPFYMFSTVFESRSSIYQCRLEAIAIAPAECIQEATAAELDRLSGRRPELRASLKRREKLLHVIRLKKCWRKKKIIVPEDSEDAEFILRIVAKVGSRDKLCRWCTLVTEFGNWSKGLIEN